LERFQRISPTAGSLVQDMKAALKVAINMMELHMIPVIVMMELAFDAPTIMKPPPAGPPPLTDLPSTKKQVKIYFLSLSLKQANRQCFYCNMK
jgi:hypothetical protein